MTVEELIAREQIRHTLAAYNQAGDADDVDRYSATFTENGSIEAKSFRCSGREAIRAWKADGKVFAGRASGIVAAFRSHHVSSVYIELTSMKTASVRSNWLVMTDIGPDHSGRYIDLFRKENDFWLIEHRQIDVLWRAQNSCIAENHLHKPSA